MNFVLTTLPLVLTTYGLHVLTFCQLPYFYTGNDLLPQTPGLRHIKIKVPNILP